jgi:coenzyme F420-dependent glucose-6-phosphate dehydrogenase
MFPRRLWLALGSGERVNEGIATEAWPEKSERNARLCECADVIRALLAGETVTPRGRITVVDCQLYSMPETPPLLLGAAVTPETAELIGSWADGLLTVSAPSEVLANVVRAFRAGGGEGKMLGSVLVSSDLDQHVAWLREFVEIGFEEPQLHQVAGNQRAFIDVFGTQVLPQLA